jgi:hypothetical protein
VPKCKLRYKSSMEIFFCLLNRKVIFVITSHNRTQAIAGGGGGGVPEGLKENN